MEQKMGTGEFLSAVVPKTGYFYLAYMTTRGMHHEPCTSVKQALTKKEKLESQGYKDIYFTPFTFDTDFYTDEKGKRRVARTQEHALWFGCICIDLDCGEGKPYRNKADIRQAVGAFLKNSKWTPPNIAVDSGGGFHLYWVFNKMIPKDRWQPLADKFKAYCFANNLYIDPAVTGDAARIMRLPGTVNDKRETPRLCEVTGVKNIINSPELMERALDGISIPTRKDAPRIEANDDLSAGIGKDDRPSYTETIVQRCDLMKYVYDNHGEDCDEPTWMSTLQLLYFTEDGTDWIHHMSDGHAQYTVADTEEKFTLRGVGGPTTCQQFEQVSTVCGINKCTDCAYRGKVKTPHSLGKEDSPPPEPEVFPRGYENRKDGVYRLRKNKKGDVALSKVISMHFLSLEVLEEHREGEGWVSSYCFDYMSGKRKTASVSDQDMNDTPSVLKALSYQRIAFNPEEVLEFRRFMNAWVTELRRVQKTKAATSHYGWQRDDDGVTGFAIGNTVFDTDGVEHTSVRQTNNFGSIYMQRGDIAPWRRSVEAVVNKGRPELEVLLASSFAAPLFDAIGVSGAVLSAVSRSSGVGKTTVLKIAQAVWGDPVVGVSALNDTSNAVVRKLSIINNLPAYWDEIRIKEDIKDFVRVMFQLGQGKEKARLDSSAGFRETGMWKTLIVCASNEPLLEHAEAMANSSNAAVMRLLEYDIQPMNLDETKGNMEASRMFSQLDHNYGHAGRIYGKWLAQNRGLVEQQIDKLSQGMEKELHTRKDERFWVSTIVCLLLGAAFAKHLGLADFNLQVLKKFLYRVFNDMRVVMHRTMNNISPEEVVASFMRMHSQQALVTDFFFDSRQPNRPVKMLRPVNENRHLSYHHAEQEQVIRVPVKEFKQFLTRQSINASSVVKELQHKGCTKTARVGLGVGTAHATQREYCYVLDIGKMGII